MREGGREEGEEGEKGGDRCPSAIRGFDVWFMLVSPIGYSAPRVGLLDVRARPFLQDLEEEEVGEEQEVEEEDEGEMRSRRWERRWTYRMKWRAPTEVSIFNLASNRSVNAHSRSLLQNYVHP